MSCNLCNGMPATAGCVFCAHEKAKAALAIARITLKNLASGRCERLGCECVPCVARRALRAMEEMER